MAQGPPTTSWVRYDDAAGGARRTARESYDSYDSYGTGSSGASGASGPDDDRRGYPDQRGYSDQGGYEERGGYDENGRYEARRYDQPAAAWEAGSGAYQQTTTAQPWRRQPRDLYDDEPAPARYRTGTRAAADTEGDEPANPFAGNRLFTVLLFLGGLGTSVSLWIFDTQPGAVNDLPTLMLAIGRVTGLIGGYLLFIQLLMMSRVSWLEDWVGSRDLLRWHRGLGTSLCVSVIAHIVFIVYGYALTAETDVVTQAFTIITTLPKMMEALAATVIMIFIALISIRGLRRLLSYEIWKGLHLSAYLVLLLGYGHQVATGADLSGRFASVFWPGLTALVISAVVWGRIVEPLWMNLRHRFEVVEVVNEGRGSFSVYIDGRNLDRLGARGGQFMRWRFLTGGAWWQSHPFSLSAAPNAQWLRLTVTAVGRYTEALRELRPGTRVWLQGPYGTFTAERRTQRLALLIAGGSGIAPIRALLEDMPSGTVVIYRAGRADEVVFRDELEELAVRRGAQVFYVVGGRNEPGPRRLLTVDGMRELVPDVSERDVYLCGPPGLVEAAIDTLSDLEVPKSQIHLDPFEF
ncbi:ferredoxin reductase family protein [Catenuloplanes atrovinosus]|uniref:Ferric reductase n=1 Tax=Catenuloplanes atrovinosus TaxID=137266 RepID=A0AAE3YQU6_9ACTN|nr:ferredoxin reductase family protein [Catenuloplanes atrovinosus]MDR7276753.1 putative ferric reductase [Catenuloplanes atrovinosus]